jgi:hypothetical protein
MTVTVRASAAHTGFDVALIILRNALIERSSASAG